MIYADTSILLSLFCPDSLTSAAVAWYQKVSDPVCISSWTVMEFRSNIGVRVRRSLLPRAKALAAIAQFDAATKAHFHLLAPAPEHFYQAGEWLAKPECALRTGDALHLAIAFGHGCKQFASFDQSLGAAARKLKLSVDLLKS